MRQQENQTLTDTRAQLELNIATLKNFNGTKEQEDKLVARMNNTYGDTMGYFSTVAGWYNALTKNSKAYCDQMIIEARIRKLVNEIAEIENKKSAIVFDESGKKKKYSTYRGWSAGSTKGKTEKELQTYRDMGYIIEGEEIYLPSELDKKQHSDGGPVRIIHISRYHHDVTALRVLGSIPDPVAYRPHAERDVDDRCDHADRYSR